MLRNVAVMCIVGAAFAASATAQNRASFSEKGSVLIYPKVEVRFDQAGNLLQDTFIQLINDHPSWSVHVLMHFVSEFCDPLHVDFDITHNQPMYWSAATGQGTRNVAPITSVLQPYPDPEGSGDMIVRGYLVIVATDWSNAQIRWNHLAGHATVVNYAGGFSYQYDAYAYAGLRGSTGSRIGDPGIVKLDGVEFSSGFNRLLLEFIPSGSMAFSGAGRLVTHETDLTLMINDVDARQERDQFYTKAHFLLWNENEVSFATEYCINCFDESLLSLRGNAFLATSLNSDMAYALIDGQASSVCDRPPDIISSERALIGVATKLLTFDNGTTQAAAHSLPGVGEQSATLWHDLIGPPEELHDPGLGNTGSAGKARSPNLDGPITWRR